MVGDIISRSYHRFRVLYVVYHREDTKIVFSDQYKFRLVSNTDIKCTNKYIWEW